MTYFRTPSLLAVCLCLLVLTVTARMPVQAFEPSCPDGCVLEGSIAGSYHMAVPDGWKADPKAKDQKVLVFFHGHGGSGAGVLRNKGLVSTFTKAGYVVIAPDGVLFPGRNLRGWPARPRENPIRDDVAFTEAMLEDAANRLGTAGFDLLVSGFSSGGSMAWHFGCYSSVKPGAIVPIAGGLRRPIPEAKCPAGPRRLMHIHGFVDNQVPLEGRGIRDWHQGDVYQGLDRLRASNLCSSKPDALSTEGTFWCRDWSSCDSGVPIRFCLHKGGHSLPKGWAAGAIDWHQGGDGIFPEDVFEIRQGSLNK